MSRRLLAAELGGLAVLCSLPGVVTMRLIEGWWELIIAALVAALGIASAVAFERLVVGRVQRRVVHAVRVAAVAIGGAVVALFTTVAVQQIVSDGSRPGPLSATGDALLHGWSSIVSAPVPSAAAPRLVVPIAVAVWVTAVSAAMLALRPRRTHAHHAASPLLPCLALLAAACLAAGAAQPSGLVVGAVALVTSGAVLVARTTARRASTHTETDEHVRGGWLRVGIALVGAALVGGVVAGPTLALGRDSDPFDPRDRLVPPVVDAAATNPLDIVALGRQQPDTVLFTVRSSAAVPIRIASLDQFDGARWSSSGEFERASVTFDQPNTGTPTRDVTAEFWLDELTHPWLPAVDLSNSLRGADVLVDTASSSFVAPADAPDNLNYIVTAALPQLDVGVLRNGLPVARDQIALRALQLPVALPLRLRELAGGITEGAPSAFDEALLINAHLASTLRIETGRPGGHSFGHLSDVLFDTGVANDDQLATAFAVLARSVGLPTRIAVGVDPSVISGAGTYDITGADLRVWPEVRFDDFGWVAFRLDGERFAGGGGILVGLDDTTTAVPSRVFDVNDTPAIIPDEPALPDDPAPAAPSRVDEADIAPEPAANSGVGTIDAAEGLGRVATAAIVGALLVLLVAVATVCLKQMRTSRRRTRDDPRQAVIGAWDDVLERLREARSDADQLPLHTVEQIIEAHRSSGSAIAAMYRPVNRALYDDRPISRADVDQVWQARDRFVASLNDTSTLRCRVQRAVDPRVLRSGARPSSNRTTTDKNIGVSA